MLPSSSSFYVTLTSDPTKEFPDNTLSRFKNRLPVTLRLHSHWRVGMTSISLPDPQQPSILQTAAPSTRICQLGWYERVTTTQYRSVNIQKTLVERMGKSFSRSEIMHSIVDMYYESRLEQAAPGATFKQVDDENPQDSLTGTIIETSHTFQWTKEGDLLWDNTKTSPYTFQPRLNFNVAFATKMEWIFYDGQSYHLGKNLEEISIATPAYPREPGDIAQMKRALQRDGKKITQGGKYWFVEEDKLLWLSDAINWKFLVHGATEHHTSQMFFIYSSLMQSSIFNNKVVNLLSEALYKKEGEGTTYFEPTTVRYLPLRSPLVDTIETHIEDSTGKQVTFPGRKTVITLHFTQDILP